MKTKTRSLSVTQLEDRTTPTVTFHGGSVLPHVGVENLYLGNDWNKPANIAVARQLEGFASTIVNSPYMDVLTQSGYGVGRGSATSGYILNYNINKGYYLTDSAIRADLQQAIRSGVAQPDANRLYVIYIEQGVAIKNDHDGNSTSINDFLGYHGAFRGTDRYGRGADIHYAVIAYPGGYNPSSRSVGMPSDFAQLTAVSSHEIAEAATDPDVNYKRLGWYDDQRGEVGDITSHYTQYMNGYYVQLCSNKQDQPMKVNNSTVYRDGQATSTSMYATIAGNSLFGNTPNKNGSSIYADGITIS